MGNHTDNFICYYHANEWTNEHKYDWKFSVIAEENQGSLSIYPRENPIYFCFNGLQAVDWRVEFSKWWISEFKTVKFPAQVPQTEQVFSYFVDPDTKKFVLWSEKLTRYELDYEIPLQVSAKIVQYHKNPIYDPIALINSNYRYNYRHIRQ